MASIILFSDEEDAATGWIVTGGVGWGCYRNQKNCYKRMGWDGRTANKRNYERLEWDERGYENQIYYQG